MNSGNLKLSTWEFRAADQERWLPAQVPGCVHLDLYRNGIIPDPFYGTNEKDLQWIDKKDFEYRTVFDLLAAAEADKRVELVFEGLDTYAEVYLNGESVISADNMFRAWKFDATGKLRAKGNELIVMFRSPIREDLPKLERLGYALPAPNDLSELGGTGDHKVCVFARKAPYHYGWDWGPRFVTSGIWREARIETWQQSRITDLYIRQDEVTVVRAKLTVIAEVESESSWEGVFCIGISGEEHLVEQSVKIVEGSNLLEIPLEIEHPRLWWCRGLGQPERYQFRARLEQGGEPVAEAEVRTGLRSLKLVAGNDPEDSPFYFELNGVPVFVKGANHIPNDSFIPAVSDDRYRHEIQSAVEANMNMLRVWGGGIYEQTVFYELCDEAGLMVWQDFMFACSMYPGSAEFLNNVRQEAEYNVKRLRNYACLALWCGNNEIDMAWSHYTEGKGWGWKENYIPEIREQIWAEYQHIFEQILPEAVARLAPSTPYWPSSPMTVLTGDANRHASNDTLRAGDVHYWGVWHSEEPFVNFGEHVGRFMSEYGFQSFPEFRTVASYAAAEDMSLESEVMLSHQRHPRGNQLIDSYMKKYYPEPKNFESFLYMSQLLQAEAIRTAVESHRRNKPHCMGTLYWQMNDCWPVASWSGMDYFGRWKALHYEMRRCFRDCAIIIEGGADQPIAVYAVSDLRNTVSGQVVIKLLNVDGDILQCMSTEVMLEESTVKCIFEDPMGQWLKDQAMEAVYVVAELELGGKIADRKVHYFVPANLFQTPVQPRVQMIRLEEDESRLILETDRLARQVMLTSSIEGVFSDNFFDLIPGMPVVIRFSKADAGRLVPASPGTIEIYTMGDFIK